MAYFDLCRLFSNESWTKDKDEVGNPYMFSGDTWISYDDKVSLAQKVKRTTTNGTIWG